MRLFTEYTVFAHCLCFGSYKLMSLLMKENITYLYLLQDIALWFNRGVGSKIQGFISGLFSAMCIDRLCQRESMMVTPMHYGENTADMNL